MKSNKAMFWFGLALNMVGNFGLLGYVFGGDLLVYIGLSIMIFSFCFELLALFFICAAFFWFQTFNNEITTVAVLGLSAIVSGILSFFCEKV